MFVHANTQVRMKGPAIEGNTNTGFIEKMIDDTLAGSKLDHFFRARFKKNLISLGFLG